MKASKFSLLSALALACVATTFAAPITITGSGTSPDGPVSGSATLTYVSPTELQLTLTNTLAAALFRSPGQSLSNFEFDLTGGTITSLGTSASSGTGTIVNINSDGSVTPTGSTNIPGTLGYGLNTNVNAGGTTYDYQLTALTGKQPDYMISPNGNSYPLANGGLTGGQFNPFVQGTATFVLNGTGFSADTTITSASFSFGTGPDYYLPGTTSVPDSGMTVALLGLGLTAVELLRRTIAKRHALTI